MIETTYSFGEWMRARREALGLARKELAARAGCSMQTIRAIEEGAMRPSQAMARALSAHLRVAQEDANVFDQGFVSVARGYQDVDTLPPANPLLLLPSFPARPVDVALSQIGSSLQSGPERNRQRMLNNVYVWWIVGVLDRALSAASISLVWKARVDAIERCWPAPLGLDEECSLATNSALARLFDEMDGKLLILGDTGAGKTILLLQLARILIERAQRDGAHPIPVVFQLTSWSVDRKPLAEWIVGELNTKYDVPHAIGQAWVEADELALLLDGLDEVPNTERAACAEAINHYRAARRHVPLVICCRTESYELLPIRLAVRGAIELLSLTETQIEKYLQRSGVSIASFREALGSNVPLTEIITTPLTLSILVRSQRFIAGMMVLNQQTLNGPTTLFKGYVGELLNRERGAPHYAEADIRHWLAGLAQMMIQHAQVVFLVERLQPDWLPRSSLQRMFALWVATLTGLVYGITISITFGTAAFVVTRDAEVLRPLYVALYAGIVDGGISGITAGVFTLWVLIRPNTMAAQSRWFWAIGRGLAYGSALGLLIGGIGGIFAAWHIHLWSAFFFCLYLGLINGGSIGLTLSLMHHPRTVTIAETIHWSWRKVWHGMSSQLAIGGLVAGVVNIVALPLFRLFSFLSVTDGLMTSLCPALITTTSMLIASGLTTGELPAEVLPNQGIRRTIQRSLALGLICFLISFVVLGSVIMLVTGRGPFVAFFGIALTWALPFGVLAAVFFGGFDCIKHVVVRYLLHRADVLPWDCGHALDYAADRGLLRKVGGGYIFVHRRLLEYFSSCGDRKEEDDAPDRPADAAHAR